MSIDKYSDIINLPHHDSKTRSRMSIEARSAQFAPFAALTGYKEKINETSRVTFDKKELSEWENDVINNKLKFINDNIKNKPLISITYYVNDEYKSGGDYYTYSGYIKRIDLDNMVIIFDDKKKISINDIIDIESDLFEGDDFYA